jgi:hypothetical protein
MLREQFVRTLQARLTGNYPGELRTILRRPTHYFRRLARDQEDVRTRAARRLPAQKPVLALQYDPTVALLHVLVYGEANIAPASGAAGRLSKAAIRPLGYPTVTLMTGKPHLNKVRRHILRVRVPYCWVSAFRAGRTR